MASCSQNSTTTLQRETAQANDTYLFGNKIQSVRKCVLSSIMILMLVSFSCGDPIVEPDPFPTAYDANMFDGDQLITEWYDVLNTCVFRSPGFSEPVAVRAYAYTSVALYESIVPGLPENTSLVGQLNGLTSIPRPDTAGKRFHWSLVANASIAEMARNLFANAPASVRSTIDSMEQKQYNDRIVLTKESDMSERSVSYGKEVAKAVFEWAKTDGGHDADKDNYPTGYTAPTNSGAWIPTPPDNKTTPMLHTWGKNRTMILQSGNPLQGMNVPSPPTFSTDKNSDFYKEAQTVYTTVKNAPLSQRSLVRFWRGVSGVAYSQPSHIFSLLSQLIRTGPYRMDETIELYTRMAITLNDGCIACFNGKFNNSLQRPISFIQQNIDRSWNRGSITDPVVTPATPEFISDNALGAVAAITIIKEKFGNSMFFTDRTGKLYGMGERDYASFTEIQNEMIRAERYSGTQFPFSITAGEQLGSQVAQAVKAKLRFRPLLAQ
jgi:hypothetical protein